MIAAILVSITFLVSSFSEGRFGPCQVDSSAPPAGVKKCNVYIISRTPRSPIFQRWTLLYGQTWVAGSHDGKPLSLYVPRVFAPPGDSVAVWAQLADSANNWQTSACGMKEFRVKP